MSHPYTEGYFTRREGSNYSGYEDGKEFERRAEILIERFHPKGKVLDVGCARGFLVNHLRHMGIDAYGVDISEWATGSVPRETLGQYLKCHDVTKGLPFADGEFDLLVSQDFLEHIEEKDVDPLLAEFRRVAKRQWHIITTLDYHCGGDDTHVCMRPVAWWQDKYKGVPDCVIETFRAV